MSEARYQSKIIKTLEADGYYVLKLISTNKNGIADLLALKAGELPWFIEVKATKGRPSPLQLYRIKECKEKGFRAELAYEGSDFLGKLTTPEK